LFIERMPSHGQGKAPRAMGPGVRFSDQTIKVAIDGNGIVHMDIPTGDTTILMAFPVSQLIKNVAVCKRAIAEWERREGPGRVVPFSQRSG
jgi:hypothetical protein